MIYSTVLSSYKIDLHSHLVYLILYGSQFPGLFPNKVLPTGYHLLVEFYNSLGMSLMNLNFHSQECQKKKKNNHQEERPLLHFDPGI